MGPMAMMMTTKALMKTSLTRTMTDIHYYVHDTIIVITR